MENLNHVSLEWYLFGQDSAAHGSEEFSCLDFDVDKISSQLRLFALNYCHSHISAKAVQGILHVVLSLSQLELL